MCVVIGYFKLLIYHWEKWSLTQTKNTHLFLTNEKQGIYLINPSDPNSTAKRWHHGVINDIYLSEDSMKTKYSGSHIERPAKLYKGYQYAFNDLTIQDLRLKTDAMDFLADIVL